MQPRESSSMPHPRCMLRGAALAWAIGAALAFQAHLPARTRPRGSGRAGAAARTLPPRRLRGGVRHPLRRAGSACAGSSADAADAGAQASLPIALPPISVFDGVFDPSATTEALGDYGPGIYRRWMHDAGIDQDEQDAEAELSPVEEFIESLLVAVGDTASEVEYWGREDWLRVEAHRDTDEPSAVEGVRRFPSRVYIACEL